jgi:hypothetical protein
MPINTTNDFLVSCSPRGMAPILPIQIRSKQQAYRTAAYLKLLATALPDEDPPSTYEDVEKAIANT